MKISKDSAITLSLFILLMIAFYFVGYWLIFRLAKATPLMLSVGLAAIITCLIRGRSLLNLAWKWDQWNYIWISYLLPLTLITTSYFIIWLMGFGQWYDLDYVTQQKDSYNLSQWSDAGIIIFHFIITASLSFIMALPSVLGEEIAWRGFLVPELSKFMQFSGVALTSGVIWAVWHWPLIFAGLYGNDVTPLYFQLMVFTVYIMAYAVILTYLRYKSNSIWTAVIYHTSGNVFLQKVFNPLTLENPQSAWYIDEFGIVLGLVTCIVAVYFWIKGRHEFKHLTSID